MSFPHLGVWVHKTKRQHLYIHSHVAKRWSFSNAERARRGKVIPTRDEPERGKLLMNANQHEGPGKAHLEGNGGSAGRQHTRSHAPCLCSRRLPHTFRKGSGPCRAAAVPQTGIDHRSAPPASVSTQRYRSCPANERPNSNSSSASGSSREQRLFSACAGQYMADRGRGINCFPHPLDPSPATQLLSERTFSSAVASLFSSGSLRIGIHMPLQAHLVSGIKLAVQARLWIGKCCAFQRSSLLLNWPAVFPFRSWHRSGIDIKPRAPRSRSRTSNAGATRISPNSAPKHVKTLILPRPPRHCEPQIEFQDVEEMGPLRGLLTM